MYHSKNDLIKIDVAKLSEDDYNKLYIMLQDIQKRQSTISNKIVNPLIEPTSFNKKILKLTEDIKIRALETDIKRKSDEIIRLKDCIVQQHDEWKKKYERLEESYYSIKELCIELDDELEHGVNFINDLSREIKACIEYESVSEFNGQTTEQNYSSESMEKERTTLKEDFTKLLTNFYNLKEENKSLRNELIEATENINESQQTIHDLQSVLTQVESYHELRHLVDSATIQQHIKLIDFLQTKFYDVAKEKRFLGVRLFNTGAKENLNQKEYENILRLERNRSNDLAEQLRKIRAELVTLKSKEIPKFLPPKLTLSNVDSDTQSFRHSSNKKCSNLGNELSIGTSIKHNIPHKFIIKICTKPGCKCIVCKNSISFGHKMSWCTECHLWTHISCESKIGPSCGLPQILLEQFLKNKNIIQSSSAKSTGKNQIIDQDKNKYTE